MSFDLRARYRLRCDPHDFATRTDDYIMFTIEVRRWWGFWTFAGCEYGLDAATLKAREHANPMPDHVVNLGPMKGEPKPVPASPNGVSQ